MASLKVAVALQAGRDVHALLDNLSTHSTPDVRTWLTLELPTCTSISLPSDRRGPIRSKRRSALSPGNRSGGARSPELVKALLSRIRDYLTHWNTNPEPFAWTATAEKLRAKAHVIRTNIRKLVEINNKKKQQDYKTLARGHWTNAS